MMQIEAVLADDGLMVGYWFWRDGEVVAIEHEVLPMKIDEHAFLADEFADTWPLRRIFMADVARLDYPERS